MSQSPRRMPELSPKPASLLDQAYESYRRFCSRLGTLPLPQEDYERRTKGIPGVWNAWNAPNE